MSYVKKSIKKSIHSEILKVSTDGKVRNNRVSEPQQIGEILPEVMAKIQRRCRRRRKRRSVGTK
jgi:hypothetical protein